MIDKEAVIRIRTAVEDLSFLKGEWRQDVDDASLRRASGPMRRLLVDGDLQRAWHDLGFDKQPIVRAHSLEVELRGIPLRLVTYAQAGGALYQGLMVATPIEIAAALSEAQIKARYEQTKNGSERDFSLRKFLASASLVAKGKQISRHLVIKYIANKLGGIHLDPKRDLSKEEEMGFHLLDQVAETYQVAGKQAIYFELLSIGQSISASTDMDRFLEVGRAATTHDGRFRDI